MDPPAHHSQNTFYNLSETVELTGVVRNFALRNPHPEIVIDVTESDGEVLTMLIRELMDFGAP